MTYAEDGFMPLDRQLFPRDVAAAIAELAKQKYPTAKAMARAWRCDISTVENLFKGHFSPTLVVKIIATEGGEFWDRLGEEITGETYEQRQERRLQTIMQEAADAHRNLVLLRTNGALLANRSGPLDPARARNMDEHFGHRSGGARPAAGVRRDPETEEARPGRLTG